MIEISLESPQKELQATNSRKSQENSRKSQAIAQKSQENSRTSVIIATENTEKCRAEALKDWDYAFQSAWPCQCSFGVHQSPLDLSLISSKTSRSSLFLRYKPAKTARAKPRNGVEVELFGDFGDIAYKNPQFPEEIATVSRISFKFPSEHTLEGRRFPLEVVISHGETLILSVFVATDGKYARNLNNFFEKLDFPLWSFEAEVSLFDSPNLMELFEEMPDFLEFFEYMGSETTPPCREAVKRLVIARPVRIPASQLRKFQAKAAKLSTSRIKLAESQAEMTKFARKRGNHGSFPGNEQKLLGKPQFLVYFSKGSENLRGDPEIRREISRKVREKLRRNKKRLFPEKYVSVSTNTSQFFVSFL